MVFDKTGTLTRGKPALTEVLAFGKHWKQQVLQLAASLEHGSEPTLATALLEAAAAQGLVLLPPQHFQAQLGEGVQAVIRGEPLWLGNRALVDRFVPKLAEVLLDQGKTVLGLMAVADTVRPEAKQAVELLQRRRIQVVMISGDNCMTDVIANVRPTDKAATISALQEASDLLLLRNDLRDVVTAIGLSLATMNKIRQNLFWALTTTARACRSPPWAGSTR